VLEVEELFRFAPFIFNLINLQQEHFFEKHMKLKILRKTKEACQKLERDYNLISQR